MSWLPASCDIQRQFVRKNYANCAYRVGTLQIGGSSPSSVDAVKRCCSTSSLPAHITSLGRSSSWQAALACLGEIGTTRTDIGPRERRRCFNAAITACERGRQWQRSLSILHDMGREGCDESHPNIVSYNAAISACSRVSRWDLSEALFAQMRDRGVGQDTGTLNAALNSYEKGSKWERCLSLLRSTEPQCDAPPDLRSYSIVLSSLAKGGDWHRSLAILQQIREAAIQPDVALYSTLMHSCVRGGAWCHGLALLSELARDGLRLDRVGFEIVLGLYRAGGLWECGLKALEEMRESDLEPSINCHIAVLRACESFEARGVGNEVSNSVKAIILNNVRASAMELLEGAVERDAVKPAAKLESRGLLLVAAVDALHRRNALDPELESRFRQMIYTPTLDALLTKEDTETSARTFLANQANLGIYFTSEVLGTLGLSSGVSTWLPTAQRSIEAYLIKSAMGPNHDAKNPSFHEIARKLPEDPSGRLLCVWVSYSIGQADTRGSGKIGWRHMCDGRVVANGRHVWKRAQIGKELEEQSRFLQPVYIGHDRAAHAERRALLQIAEQILHSTSAPGSGEAAGTVRLYSVHTPCTSCLAVFKQFRQLFPRIRLNVEFASWDESRTQVLNSLASCKDVK